MDFIKLIPVLLAWITLISFYFCIILIIVPIYIIHTCVVITYYMFEYKTFDLDKISNELNKPLKDRRKPQ